MTRASNSSRLAISSRGATVIPLGDVWIDRGARPRTSIRKDGRNGSPRPGIIGSDVDQNSAQRTPGALAQPDHLDPVAEKARPWPRGAEAQRVPTRGRRAGHWTAGANMDRATTPGAPSERRPPR